MSDKGFSIHFLGVGDAFDTRRGNSSVLVRSAATTLLVDCGYAVPSALFELDLDPNELDGIYLTHFHADHYFGVPALLTRFLEDKRSKPLTILGQAPLQTTIETLMESAYRSVRAKLPFALEFVECMPGVPQQWKHFTIHTAKTVHPVTNMAARFDTDMLRLGVSGDGEMTEESRRLFSGATHLIHEAWTLNESAPNHTSSAEVLGFASTVPTLKNIWLVHVRRDLRDRAEELFANEPSAEHTPVTILPSRGSSFTLS